MFKPNFKSNIKEIIGNLTKPKNSVNYGGDLFVEIFPYELPSSIKNKYEYKYNYQEFKQNLFGVWKPATCWLQKNSEIYNVS